MTDVVWSFHHRNWTGRLTRAVHEILPGSTLVQGDVSIADVVIDRLMVNQAGANFASEPERAAIARAIVTAREVVWMRNDYTSTHPKITSEAGTPFRACARERHRVGRPPLRIWSSVASRDETYVNWNVFASGPRRCAHSPTHAGLIYYTKYRPGREIYYDRYLSEPSCPVYLSRPDRGKSQYFRKFAHPNVHHLPPLHDVLGELGNYACSLYLEDTWSHDNYCSPASRFYEVMSTIGVMLFQPEAARTMASGGYQLRDDWIVSDGSQLTKDVDHLRTEQSGMISQIYEERERVSHQVRAMWEAL